MAPFVRRSLMAPLDTVLITNTVSRVPLPFVKNRSTPVLQKNDRRSIGTASLSLADIQEAGIDLLQWAERCVLRVGYRTDGCWSSPPPPSAKSGVWASRAPPAETPAIAKRRRRDSRVPGCFMPNLSCVGSFAGSAPRLLDVGGTRGSAFLVRVEDVILRLHYRMTRVSAV